MVETKIIIEEKTRNSILEASFGNVQKYFRAFSSRTVRELFRAEPNFFFSNSSRAQIFELDELRAQAELGPSHSRAEPSLVLFGLGSAR